MYFDCNDHHISIFTKITANAPIFIINTTNGFPPTLYMIALSIINPYFDIMDWLSTTAVVSHILFVTVLSGLHNDETPWNTFYEILLSIAPIHNQLVNAISP